eukprot:gene14943-615_t
MALPCQIFVESNFHNVKKMDIGTAVPNHFLKPPSKQIKFDVTTQPPSNGSLPNEPNTDVDKFMEGMTPNASGAGANQTVENEYDVEAEGNTQSLDHAMMYVSQVVSVPLSSMKRPQSDCATRQDPASDAVRFEKLNNEFNGNLNVFQPAEISQPAVSHTLQRGVLYPFYVWVDVALGNDDLVEAVNNACDGRLNIVDSHGKGEVIGGNTSRAVLTRL